MCFKFWERENRTFELGSKKIMISIKINTAWGRMCGPSSAS